MFRRPPRRIICARSRAFAQTTPAAEPPSFVEFAWTAREDVTSVLRQHEDASWVDRLHNLSAFALEVWPPEAPHWRVVAPLVTPPSRSSAQELAAALAVSVEGTGAASSGSRGGLRPPERATCLRTLCALQSSQRTSRQLAPLMAGLLDSGGVASSINGLAYQLSLDDLRLCAIAVGHSRRQSPQEESPLRSFMTEARTRLSAVRTTLSFADLYDIRSALHACSVECDDIDSELRGRLQMLHRPVTDDTAEDGERDDLPTMLRVESKAELDVTSILACASMLGESSALRGELLRLALLPTSLRPGSAARLLRHATPVAGGTPSPAHDLVVAMAAAKLTSSAPQLGVLEITNALQGVLLLQASGTDIMIQEAAKVLRALWPRVTQRLSNMGPEGLGAALRSYWWQLNFTHQELALTGVAHAHPIVKMAVATPSGGWSNRSHVKGHEATEDLKAKLLWPVFARLSEMPLAQITACLTAVAPPVSPPDALTDADRAKIRREVETSFPPGGLAPLDRCGLRKENRSEDELKVWFDDFWNAEVQGLSGAEVLELACGLREVAPDLHDPEDGKHWWVLVRLLSELERRLRSTGPGKHRPSMELSHFLLLRMCRIMDLWQGHEVEDVLKHLLSNPEAVRPLPTSMFVAVLVALRDFAVPRELPLRLAASFLDRVDRGECEVQPTQWADLICAIRPVDGPPSWERVTPRLIQQLVPTIPILPPPVLADVLRALSSGVLPADGAGPDSAFARAPIVAAASASKALRGGKWEFREVVDVLNSFGQLEWYSDLVVAAALASCMQTSLLQSHAPLLLPLARACVALRVHHAPLLHKMVLWYSWCYTYLWTKPLATEQIDELIAFTDQLLELSFQSLELHAILAENLKNPNASSKQVLSLLAALARLSHFPMVFKEACAKVCSESSASDLATLSNADLISAFNIHLCAVFDGPAALKHWLTEDEDMKAFFQMHTSQKWYQNQDRDRATFLQSSAYMTLREAVEAEGLDLRPSDQGEVYHIELVSRDAKDRLNSWSNNPPTAVVCIKSKEQLQWYVPITSENTSSEVEPVHNRCRQFGFMFRGAVQKIRHLQAMGYRVSVIWMSEWRRLETLEQRRQYLRDSLGVQSGGVQHAAFSPSSEQDAYV